MKSSNIGYLSTKKLIYVGIVLIFVFGFLFIFVFSGGQKAVIEKKSLSKDSSIIKSENTTISSLQPLDGYIYKTKSMGLDAAKEFIKDSPRVGGEKIVPDNFDKNSILTKSIDDSSDQFLKSTNVNINNQHFFFNQTIQGIPVFNGTLGIHLRNGNEIYSVDGRLVFNQQLGEERISENEARDIALQKAKLDARNAEHLMIAETNKYVFNKKILNQEEDETNYVVLAVHIENKDQNTQLFNRDFFVDLVTGNILYEVNNVRHAKNISVSNTENGLTRTTNQAAVGDVNVDNIYSWLNSFYDYFFNNFQRDGPNGAGGLMSARILPPCANAASDGIGNIELCNDFITQDIVMHEMGHVIVGSSANFNAGAEGSALHEAFADIWMVPFDHNWIADKPGGGIERNIQDPLALGYPDKLFSTNWECGGELGSEHVNGVVFSHAVSLMALGGNRNGCAITSIGEENVLKIAYQALTKYLTSSANYLDAYNAMNNGCNDLFQQGSETCASVQAALVATEIDQQPAGTQDSPICSGGQEKTPICPTTTNISPSTIAVSPIPSSVCLGNCPTEIPGPTSATPTNNMVTIAYPSTVAPSTLISINPSISTIDISSGGDNKQKGIVGFLLLILAIIINFLADGRDLIFSFIHAIVNFLGNLFK